MTVPTVTFITTFSLTNAVALQLRHRSDLIEHQPAPPDEVEQQSMSRRGRWPFIHKRLQDADGARQQVISKVCGGHPPDPGMGSDRLPPALRLPSAPGLQIAIGAATTKKTLDPKGVKLTFDLDAVLVHIYPRSWASG